MSNDRDRLWSMKSKRVFVDGRWVAPVPAEFHGRPSTYGYRWCRCLVCIKGNTDRQKRLRDARRAARVLKSGVLVAVNVERHGVACNYSNHGCQCLACFDAAKEYMRVYATTRREREVARGES